MSIASPQPAKIGPSGNSTDEPIRSGVSDAVTPAPTKKPWVKWIVGCVVLIAAGAAAFYFVRTGWFSGPSVELIYYTVKRGNLPIVVTERGTVESQESVDVLCEADDLPNDGYRGTPIRWIIPNGSTVTKGQLIVELEDQGHRERLDRQKISRERAYAEKIQADAKYNNQLIQNQTMKANAELEVELAKLELKMFKDEVSGTHKLEVEEIKRRIDDINTEILAAQASLELAKKELRATETLFRLGYAGKSELDRSKLEVLQAESKYASKMNALQTQLATLRKKETYERQKQLLTLEGKLATALRKVKQVEEDNKALLAQAKAARDAALQTFQREDELLKRYEKSLQACKIYAPADGMVAYAAKDTRKFWLDDIAQGRPVSPKQKILSIPNLKKMQVRTQIHESDIDQVRKGLKATIAVEAVPDKEFQGEVGTVAVLADQQSAETRVYDTIVLITSDVQQLKPGMTAVVEIHVKTLKNVLAIPVQAVVQIGSDTWVYVDNGGGVERRLVTLGATNHKLVEVREGIDEGDRVVLNPTAILEATESDDQQSGPSSSEAAPEEVSQR